MGETQRFSDLLKHWISEFNICATILLYFIRLFDICIKQAKKHRCETNNKYVHLHVYPHPKQTYRSAVVLFSALTKLLDEITVSL